MSSGINKVGNFALLKSGNHAYIKQAQYVSLEDFTLFELLWAHVNNEQAPMICNINYYVSQISSVYYLLQTHLITPPKDKLFKFIFKERGLTNLV